MKMKLKIWQIMLIYLLFSFISAFSSNLFNFSLTGNTKEIFFKLNNILYGLILSFIIIIILFKFKLIEIDL